MSQKKNKEATDITTEEKIKEAARTVFYKKGYAATRTRDIAEEAGINLALLNYYFRSKQKLFEMIMVETLSFFVQNMIEVLNDEKTSLTEKVEAIVSGYIDLIIREPEIPGFIVSEVRNNPDVLLQRIPVKKFIKESVFFVQHRVAVEDGRVAEPDPIHFMLNILGLTVFPFIVKPMITRAGDLSEAAFNKLMQERKTLIPVWVKAMIQEK
ncbi:MAG: TetR/AcrR family transcriptional regulator [Niabella sp.]